MKVYSVYDEEFRPYGKVLGGYDTAELRAAMEADAADQQPAPDPAAFRQKVADVLDVLKAADVDEGTKNELLRGIIEKIEYHKPENRFDIYFAP